MASMAPSSPDHSPSDHSNGAPNGMKIVFVGIVLILIAGVFVLTNTRWSLTANGSFSLVADKTDAAYFDFEMPIFRVKGARPGSEVIAELTRDGKLVARTGSGVVIDDSGQGLIRGDFVTDEDSKDYLGSWRLTARDETGQEAAVDYSITTGCSEDTDLTIVTDKQEYTVGEEIRYTVRGPKNTQIRWFGLSGREGRLNLSEANAYYGDVTDANGEWESRGIIARIPDPINSEANATSIVSLCDKTAQAKVTIRR